MLEQSLEEKTEQVRQVNKIEQKTLNFQINDQ